MLGLARRVNARFLTMTSEVYGDPEIHPQPETYNGSVILGIRSCYDELKELNLYVLTTTECMEGYKSSENI